MEKCCNENTGTEVNASYFKEITAILEIRNLGGSTAIQIDSWPKLSLSSSR